MCNQFNLDFLDVFGEILQLRIYQFRFFFLFNFNKQKHGPDLARDLLYTLSTKTGYNAIY